MGRKVLNIGMRDEYSDKKQCRVIARDIIEKKQITGMTERQMAAEIFTHGYIYSHYDGLPGFLKRSRIASRVYKCCENGVDLADNGDIWYRKIVYFLIYLFLRGKH